MSFLQKIIKKKPAADAVEDDPRKMDKSLNGGRRGGENANPYLSARRTWNEHIQSQVASRKMWQMVAVLSLLIVLTAVGGVIHTASQSKFIPYIIETDKLGTAVAVGPVRPSTSADVRVVRALVGEFITDARMVTPDLTLQRNAVFRVYAKINADDPAMLKMNEWMNGTPSETPFKRAEKFMVSTEILTILPQTPDTWMVEWTETVRNRQGVRTGPDINMRALVTVYTTQPNNKTAASEIQKNPIGLYVRDFTWSRLITEDMK